MSKERGIPMSGWSVGRILADAKTQTRRPLKDQFTEWPRWWCDWRERDGVWSLYDDLGNHLPGYPELRCPYGVPGNLLYCKEEWLEMPPEYPHQDAAVLYRASVPDDGPHYKWKRARFMPKKHARIWLRITDIRLEQVQEISEEDIRAEGTQYLPPPADKANYNIEPTATDRFRELYDSIYAESGRGWDKNEWVFAYTFERIERKASE